MKCGKPMEQQKVLVLLRRAAYFYLPTNQTSNDEKQKVFVRASGNGRGAPGL